MAWAIKNTNRLLLLRHLKMSIIHNTTANKKKMRANFESSSKKSFEICFCLASLCPSARNILPLRSEEASRQINDARLPDLRRTQCYLPNASLDVDAFVMFSSGTF